MFYACMLLIDKYVFQMMIVMGVIGLIILIIIIGKLFTFTLIFYFTPYFPNNLKIHKANVLEYIFNIYNHTLTI